MNYAQIRQFDTANGTGIACTLFVSGCNFFCKNCFNKEYQDFNYGNLWTKEVKNNFIKMCLNPNVDHVSILGGEPLSQDYETMYDLIKSIKEEVKKPIWLWTGHIYEELSIKQKEIVSMVDYLIDGQFIEKLKNYKLNFKGSSNQRILDVQKSLKENKVILYDC